jgi:hypothetical protein
VHDVVDDHGPVRIRWRPPIEANEVNFPMRAALSCYESCWSALATLLVVVAGCSSADGGGSGGSNVPVADYSKVRSITAFYEAYLGEHRGQPPQDEQAFRAYLATKQDRLQKVGLTVEQMFVSPRNGKPLAWVYGMSPPLWRQTGITCYGYEAEPSNGKRLVIGSRGMYDEMDQSQFKSVFPKAQ